MTDSNPQPGDIYQKRATTKTSVNAPMIAVCGRDELVRVRPLNFCGKHGFTLMSAKGMTLAVLDRDWRKVGQ